MQDEGMAKMAPLLPYSHDQLLLYREKRLEHLAPKTIVAYPFVTNVYKI